MFEVARCRNLFLGEATNALGFLEESIIIVWFLFRLLIEGNCYEWLLTVCMPYLLYGVPEVFDLLGNGGGNLSQPLQFILLCPHLLHL